MPRSSILDLNPQSLLPGLGAKRRSEFNTLAESHEDEDGGSRIEDRSRLFLDLLSSILDS